MPVTSSVDDGSSPTAESFPPEEVIFGCSAAMAAIRQTVAKIAHTNLPVVLRGKGGTGKELLARWIHVHSQYSHGEFVKINCAAIPNQLLESELFGYEKGAFTGAYASKLGMVELANKGTLFLDEIAELDPCMQAKLLQFLQDGSFFRIGDETGKQRFVDTRLICATSQDLEKLIKTSRFRADLFYRINVVQLGLPSLCDRREDIPQLADYLRRKYEIQFGKTSEPFRPEALDRLQNMSWPGNVRELSNEVARYVLIGSDGLISSAPSRQTEGKSGTAADANAGLPLKRIAREAIRQMERNVIQQALWANKWNRRKTAQSLKISYRALIYKISEAGLSSRNSSSKRDPAGNRQ
jgi:two-component system response regulator AtoC